jgi:ferric-dicitrate binding protein FerR (iron transport regulator)
MQSGDNQAVKARIEKMAARLLFDGRVADGVADDIRSRLADADDAGLKREVLQKVFLTAFRSSPAGGRSEAAAREWPRLAASLGLNPDLGHYRALWRGRAVRRPARRRVWLRVAAVLLPAALVVGGWLWRDSLLPDRAADTIATVAAPFVAEHSVAARADSIRHITLADGTEVTLNRGASFSYNDDRECELSGEAWFKVAKDPRHPFVIHSEHLTVTVLGTEFNFDTGAAQGISRLSLYGGRVRLDYPAGTREMAGAGHEFSLDHATAKADVRDFDREQKPLWLASEGEWINLQSLDAIFDQIEARYGVTIVNRGAVDTARQYNFEIDSSLSLDGMMAALAYVNGEFDYRIEGNRVTVEARPIKKTDRNEI